MLTNVDPSARELPAGRELDALVAEKVMGYQWFAVRPVAARDRVRVLLAPGTKDIDGQWSRASLRDARHGSYSTSWDAMRLVVERLIALGWIVEMTAGIASCDVTLYFDTTRGIRVPIDSTGDSLPHAVCLAALAVVADHA